MLSTISLINDLKEGEQVFAYFKNIKDNGYIKQIYNGGFVIKTIITWGQLIFLKNHLMMGRKPN